MSAKVQNDATGSPLAGSDQVAAAADQADQAAAAAAAAAAEKQRQEQPAQPASPLQPAQPASPLQPAQPAPPLQPASPSQQTNPNTKQQRQQTSPQRTQTILNDRPQTTALHTNTENNYDIKVSNLKFNGSTFKEGGQIGVNGFYFTINAQGGLEANAKSSFSFFGGGQKNKSQKNRRQPEQFAGMLDKLMES
jgi:hypothetical protein